MIYWLRILWKDIQLAWLHYRELRLQSKIFILKVKLSRPNS